MPELTVNYSQSMAALIREEGIQVAGLEVGPYFSLAQITAAQQNLPGLRFELHASRLGLLRYTRPVLDAYLKVTHSRWISCHLSLLSPLEVQLGLRWQRYVLFSNPQKAQAGLVESARRLRQTGPLPVILENMPGFPSKRHLFESDPLVISQILQATECGLLLDLGHARVAAGLRGLSPEDYLERLPLQQTRQIHVSGPRPRNGVLFDAHEPLREEDYALLEWTLARTRPEVVTLEYFRDKDELRAQILRLQGIIL